MEAKSTNPCVRCAAHKKAFDHLHGKYVALLDAICTADYAALAEAKNQREAITRVMQATTPIKPWAQGEDAEVCHACQGTNVVRVEYGANPGDKFEDRKCVTCGGTGRVGV